MVIYDNQNAIFKLNLINLFCDINNILNFNFQFYNSFVNNVNDEHFVFDRRLRNSLIKCDVTNDDITLDLVRR